jgi:hypothetical protein
MKKLYAKQYLVQWLVTADKFPKDEKHDRAVAIVQSTGTGQGLQKCSLYSNSMSNKCTVVTKAVLCNSICHTRKPQFQKWQFT